MSLGSCPAIAGSSRWFLCIVVTILGISSTTYSFSLTASRAIGMASGFSGRISATSTAVTSSDTQETTKIFATPLDRVVFDDLPIVYVYDHCPFCVRVRTALGIKNVKHTVHFLANDDIPTPTKLVGKKIAPIFAFPEDDLVMAESMDIVRFIDSDERFGPTNFILPSTGRSDIKAWQSSTRDLLRTLQRPRYVATGLLPEFQQLDGRHAFIKNHQLPPYERDEWKGGTSLSMEDKLRIYAEAMANDPTFLVEELNMKLVELDDIIYCENHCSESGFTLDDIDLFSRLRSITIIKGVQWPQKLRSYMDKISELADVPLYDQMAL